MSRLCAKPTCSDVAERWFDVCAAECEVVERREATPSTIAFCGSHAARFSVPNGWEWIALHPIESTPSRTQDSSTAPPTTEKTTTAEANTVELETTEPVTGREDESSNDSIGAPHRLHTRDAPWFLANAAPSDAAPRDTEILDDRSDLSESADSTPSAGSLLHRAFHGPDRDRDVARARDADRDHGGRREERTQSEPNNNDDDDDDVATVRDLATQRTARAATARSSTGRPKTAPSDTTSYDVELPFPPVDAEPHVAVS